jgi:prephenate dehydrogenase
VNPDRSVAVIGPVLIIGTGLIGTSIALSLRRAGVEVLLEDLDSEQAQVAVAMGAGTIAGSEAEPALVVVAVPPRHAAQVLARASVDFPFATITDVTSVKERVLAEACDLGADPGRLVGGHPMAGREVSGAASARPDLLDDRLWIITPTEMTRPEHQRAAHQLATTCGAYPIELSAAEHDRAVALVSHAPQLLSSVLAAQLVDADAAYVQVAGQGLRDMTRIAGSQSALWTDILGVNAAPVADVLDGVIYDLQRAARALRAVATGEPASIDVVTEELQRGAIGRGRIPGKHGASPSTYLEVAVMLADRPGELGRLFTAVGETTVNLEDVRIEHVLGKQSGLVELSVQPDSVTTLEEALRSRGFDVRG